MTTLRQLSFSGGEVTPSLWGRTDLGKYASGLKLCKNFMVMRHGGVQNRSGTTFTGEVQDSSKKTRLHNFVFDLTQTYVLEFGDLYMRVIRNNTHVKDLTNGVTGATQANPGVLTTSATHTFSNGDHVFLSGIGGMVELNNRTVEVANVTATTFEVNNLDGTNLDTSGFTAFSSNGVVERLYTLTTTYTEAELFDLYFDQSADVIHIAHPLHAPAELARTGHSSWTLTDTVFGPSVLPPTSLSSDAAGATYTYVITAIDEDTSEESLISAEVTSSSRTSTLSWTASVGASTYNVYFKEYGIYAWVALVGGTSFTDNTLAADAGILAPVDRQLFASAGNYPSTVSFYQQRLLFGNTTNNPETVFGSKTGLRKNFNTSTPLRSDDAITFSLAGNRVQTVRHILSTNKLLLLTDSGEWVVAGGIAGALTPTDLSPTQQTANGANYLPPIFVAGTALYVQARGSVVRDLNFDFNTDGYKGNELSIFSAHLFDGKTMVDWEYHQIPNSVIWLVRNDGKVVAMTYIREHALFAWHQHDFGGDVESVTVIPEGTEDVAYFTIKRTINGKTVRYIERLSTRQITDARDGIFMDSTLSYDGRNTGSGTVTFSSTGGWTHDDTITATASAATFTSGDVGNGIWLTDSLGETIRMTITGFTSTTVVTGRPHKTVPATLQAVAVTVWTLAVDQLAGLWHLEGEDVSVLADGTVSASPNNSSYETKSVANGIVTLDEPHGVVRIGLPYISDLTTLDLDRPDAILTNKTKHVGRVTLQVESSRGIFAGLSFDELTELRSRADENYGESPRLRTGPVEMNIFSAQNKTGDIYIRQVDPLPVAVLSIIPAGMILGGKK